MLSATWLLAGCATNLTATTSEAQCAGRKPIVYTSKNRSSPYYAAPKAASQIVVTNRTGENLKCPGF
jgi:hypothetical protein